MTDYEVKLGAGQPAFTTETRENDYEIEFPLGPAEPTALVARAKFSIFRSSYARPAANSTVSITVNGGSQTFYFIDDIDFQNVRGPWLRFTRLYATIPASWNDPVALPYSYPSYVPTSLGSAKAVTAIAWNSGNFDHIVTTSTAHGLVAGNTAFFNLNYTFGGLVVAQSLFALIISAPSTTTVEISGLAVTGPGSFTGVSGNLYAATIGRLQPETIIAAARVQNDYALTSTTSLNDDLPLAQPFSPIDSTGAVTTALSTTTFPTAAAYSALVAAGTELVADCTRERYMGNIYVRRTRYVPAM